MAEDKNLVEWRIGTIRTSLAAVLWPSGKLFFYLWDVRVHMLGGQTCCWCRSANLLVAPTNDPGANILALRETHTHGDPSVGKKGKRFGPDKTNPFLRCLHGGRDRWENDCPLAGWVHDGTVYTEGADRINGKGRIQYCQLFIVKTWQDYFCQQSRPENLRIFKKPATLPYFHIPQPMLF